MSALPPDQWLRTGLVRRRQADIPRIRSMLEVAEMRALTAVQITITERSAISVFSELYEAIRQLGDAHLWLQNLEPRDHEVSLAALQAMTVKEAAQLNHLDRFRRIRNDVNYRGHRTSVEQAQEILGFWNACGAEILMLLRSELTRRKTQS